MSRKMRFEKASEMPPMAVSLSDTTLNKTGSWRYLRPVMQEKLAPCRAACPAGTDLPRVLHLIGEGRWREAYHLIRAENPLPAVCGRVCYHPCELACSRCNYDQPASIQALERFTAEMAGREAFTPLREPARRERVAIVGSGPAGLSCAYFLALKGLHCTIFEADDEPGGMLRSGIPSYRLPRSVLNHEIEQIARLGVEFRLGCRIGDQVSLHRLRRDYDAVFIACGAQRSLRLPMSQDHPTRVMPGLEFLKQVNAGKPPQVGPEVLVIGGGNTAIDAARVALRLGLRPTVAYRRTQQEMPAVPSEIEAAQEEGVRFHFLVAPRAFRDRPDGLEVELIRVRLGAIDESGRARPEPIPGSEFSVVVDSVLEAVGEGSDLKSLLRDFRDQRSPSSEDQALKSLKQAGFLVGGDAETGPSSVVQAIASGKRAAGQILNQLARDAELPQARSLTPFSVSDLNLAYFSRSTRVRPRHLSTQQRIKSFEEVVCTLWPSEAVREAQRCFSCGVCNQCDNCWVFCPESAVLRPGNGDGYQLNLDYCKGCGICAQECPRGVISLIKEEQ